MFNQENANFRGASCVSEAEGLQGIYCRSKQPEASKQELHI